MLTSLVLPLFLLDFPSVMFYLFFFSPGFSHFPHLYTLISLISLLKNKKTTSFSDYVTVYSRSVHRNTKSEASPVIARKVDSANQVQTPS